MADLHRETPIPNKIIPSADLLVRVQEAVKIARDNANLIDGEDFNAWVIDQMLRALLGSVNYKKFIRHHDRIYGDPWRRGVPPV